MNHCQPRISVRSKLALLASMAFAATTPAFAVLDVSAVTTSVAEVGVAMLAIIGAFLAVSVLILGISKVYRFVSRKAGG